MEFAMGFEIVVLLVSGIIFAATILILVLLSQKTFYLLVWIPLLVDIAIWIFSGTELVAKLKSQGIGGGPGWGGDVIRPLALLLLYGPALPMIVAVLCVYPPSPAWRLKTFLISLLIAAVGAVIVIYFSQKVGASLGLD